MVHDFEHALAQYAETIVRVGLNLRSGQRLVVHAPILAAPLVRRIAESAYRAGARLVNVVFEDEHLTLIRFQNAPRDSFTEFPAWRARLMDETFAAQDAYLRIYAEDPDLLKEQDPGLIATAQKAAMQHIGPAVARQMRNESNWCVVSLPVPSWAARVFPDLSQEQAMQRLWDVIFSVTRLNLSDPVIAWQEHVRLLGARSTYLTRKQYDALHFSGPGTDLTVGLPAGHRWMGGQIRAASGIDFIPNMPTEEVFTMPHKDRADGVVRASLPLSYAGALIENIQLTFRQGRVVDFRADKGQEALAHLLEADEGARRLGEVALVPHSSPISQSGILFYNTLFDENAASHLALGKAYQFTMQGGEDMPAEVFQAAGGNHSLMHVDFMIGSAQMDVDGVLEDGNAEPLMRAGEWVIAA
jgi:aminopeptidase